MRKMVPSHSWLGRSRAISVSADPSFYLDTKFLGVQQRVRNWNLSSGYPKADSTSTYLHFDRRRRCTTRSNRVELLTRYSSTKLTGPNARLMTIEGLARIIQAISIERYVVGMRVEWIDK
ncbi:hypothetical protein V8C42DRAFT_336446 [Trichoderma barbatum]